MTGDAIGRRDAPSRTRIPNGGSPWTAARPRRSEAMTRDHRLREESPDTDQGQPGDHCKEVRNEQKQESDEGDGEAAGSGAPRTHAPNERTCHWRGDHRWQEDEENEAQRGHDPFHFSQ